MANICMVTVDHSPFDDRIFYKECWSLKKAGHQLTILCTGDENGHVKDMSQQNILKVDEEGSFLVDEVRVIPVPFPKGFFQKSLNKFFLSRYFRDFIRWGTDLNADVYHAHESVSYFIARKIQKKNGAKVVYDEHGALLGATPKDKFIKRFYLKGLKYLITANPLTRGSFLHRNHLLKTEVINNYPRQDIFPPVFREDKFKEVTIAHEGSLPFDRGLKTMIEVMKKVCQDYPQVRLKIIGEAFNEEREYLDEKRAEYGLEQNIVETGWLDYEKVGKELEDCSIGLILKTHTAKNFLVEPPMKLFHYLIYGMAVIDVGFPESTRMLNKFNTGITVRERSVDNIYAAIKQLLEDTDFLKDQCQKAYEARSELNWDTEEQKLLAFYENEVLNEDPLYTR